MIYFNQFLESKKSFVEKSQKVAFILFCAIVFDCAFTGSGRWLVVFGVTPRMICFALCFIFCIPAFFIRIRENIKSPLIIGTALFLSWLILSAIIGIINHNNLEVLTADIKGFMYLMLIPVAVNTITDKARFEKLLNIVIIGALCQAVLIFVLNVICSFSESSILPLSEIVISKGFGTLSCVSGNIFRIFTKSSPFMIVACAICIAKLSANPKIDWKYIGTIVLCLTALLYSFTRSLFLGAGITALIICIVLVCINPKSLLNLIRSIALTALCFLVFIGATEIVFQANSLNFAIARTFNTDIKNSFTSTLVADISKYIYSKNHNTDSEDSSFNDQQSETDSSVTDSSSSDIPSKEQELNQSIKAEENRQQQYLEITAVSDNIRQVTEKELLELFYKNPIIGQGLGACSETRAGNDEYFYLDLLCRTGIIGLILYMTPFLAVVILVFTRYRKFLSSNINTVSVVVATLAFWIATAFNPWMNASIGISCYAIVCTVPVILEKEKTKRNEAN